MVNSNIGSIKFGIEKKAKAIFIFKANFNLIL